MNVTIRTDHKWKPLKYRREVPESILLDQFEHLPEDEGGDGFLQYRGRYYHTSDFMRMHHNEEMKDWHGYASDSYFSGVVIRLSDDGEGYQIGRYCS